MHILMSVYYTNCFSLCIGHVFRLPVFSLIKNGSFLFMLFFAINSFERKRTFMFFILLFLSLINLLRSSCPSGQTCNIGK